MSSPGTKQQRKLGNRGPQRDQKHNQPANSSSFNKKSQKPQPPKLLKPQKSQQQQQQQQQQQKQPQPQPQQQMMMSTAPIAKRVYILSHTGDDKIVAIKEVQYVVPGTVDKTPSGTRPVWVPAYILSNNWCLQPPCFWSTQILTLSEIESSGGRLLYNPFSDYSLELIRCFQPEMFNALFKVFCLFNKKLFSSRQLEEIKSSVQAQNLPLYDVDLNFSPQSPVAAILNSPQAGTELMSQIEHYLVLLRIRAHSMRAHLAMVK